MVSPCKRPLLCLVCVIAYFLERLPVDEIVPFKDVSIFEPFETELEEAWNVLRKYRSEMPYDSRCSRVSIFLIKECVEYSGEFIC